MSNVIPLRPGARPLSSIHPAGQVLSTEATNQIIADYRTSASAWRWAAIGFGLIAVWQYRKYVVKPAQSGAKRLASARSALG